MIDKVLLDTTDRLGFGGGDFPVRTVVVLGVVAPLVALAVSLLGPLWLAARPRFDDMIDGLTFGVVSGAAYAAGETLMMHRDVIGAGDISRDGAVLWMSIVANATIVKPVVYGAAVGIAAASFSGIGPGFEGFGRRFGKGMAIAAVAMVAYGAGVAVLGEVDGAPGAALGLPVGCRRGRGPDRGPPDAAPRRDSRSGAGSRSRSSQPSRGARRSPLR